MKDNSIINTIDNAIKEIKNFSGVVKIQRKEEVLFNKAYGFADIANKRENNLNTRFGIASGAKLFTAIAICKLVEEKKLSFDSLLKDYIDIDNFNDDVTIKHLLTHTSGLPDYFDEEVMDDFSELWIDNPMYTMTKPIDFIDLMKNLKQMFKPGEKFYYNNGAFVVLAYVVEKVSGLSFTQYVKENILDKLNMNCSGYFRMDMLPGNCAFGYEQLEDGSFKTNIYSIPVIGGGDGGIFVTADDMSKLWNGLFSYKLLNKETTDELLDIHAHDCDDFYYGYGIWIEKKNDSVFKYYITGSDPGVSFLSIVYPENKLEVTILGNKEFTSQKFIETIESLKL